LSLDYLSIALNLGVSFRLVSTDSEHHHLIVGPTGETLLLEEDSLICLGTVEQLRKLNHILCPLSPSTLRLPNKQK
jgi:hypothetical protein